VCVCGCVEQWTKRPTVPVLLRKKPTTPQKNSNKKAAFLAVRRKKAIGCDEGKGGYKLVDQGEGTGRRMGRKRRKDKGKQKTESCRGGSTKGVQSPCGALKNQWNRAPSPSVTRVRLPYKEPWRTKKCCRRIASRAACLIRGLAILPALQ
jgi:hypothetical protein